MLIQLHHQFKDDTTDMRAQREIADDRFTREGHAELKRFFEETAKNHPLPEGAKWLAVPEDSPRFWKVPA